MIGLGATAMLMASLKRTAEESLRGYVTFPVNYMDQMVPG
jgi:hypothetical protein